MSRSLRCRHHLAIATTGLFAPRALAEECAIGGFVCCVQLYGGARNFYNAALGRCEVVVSSCLPGEGYDTKTNTCVDPTAELAAALSRTSTTTSTTTTPPSAPRNCGRGTADAAAPGGCSCEMGWETSALAEEPCSVPSFEQAGVVTSINGSSVDRRKPGEASVALSSPLAWVPPVALVAGILLCLLSVLWCSCRCLCRKSRDNSPEEGVLAQPGAPLEASRPVTPQLPYPGAPAIEAPIAGMPTLMTSYGRSWLADGPHCGVQLSYADCRPPQTLGAPAPWHCNQTFAGGPPLWRELAYPPSSGQPSQHMGHGAGYFASPPYGAGAPFSSPLPPLGGHPAHHPVAPVAALPLRPPQPQAPPPHASPRLAHQPVAQRRPSWHRSNAMATPGAAPWAGPGAATTAARRFATPVRAVTGVTLPRRSPAAAGPRRSWSRTPAGVGVAPPAHRGPNCR